MGSYCTEFRYRNPETGKLDGNLVPVDFAQNAESYGCKAYTVRNEAELIEAIKDSKKQNRSTLLDIKVLPKTMTDGYESWWRVCSPEVAEKASVMKAADGIRRELQKARKY